MPDYVAPGVFIEETSFRPKSIEGVSTSVTAFVGPTHKGPIASASKLLTSFADFEKAYGGADDLRFAPRLNYLAHGVRAYFTEGGARLYVIRVAAKSKKGRALATVAPTPTDYNKAFALLAALPAVSIVAAPGHTAFPAATALGVARQLVAHAEQLRYRVAVLDTPAGLTVTEAAAYKANFDSKLAALYYPWVVVAHPGFKPTNPGSIADIALPPSAFVCGIYVRTDVERGVHKAPANEVVRSALRLERAISAAEQNILNPLGVNCLRFFTGKGNLVWGARTLSSDSEWKYINLRRYFAYLERSIDEGTRWAVFEPNDEPLWARVRDSVSNFLLGEWRNGALQGAKAEQAYFVKCDRTTMTQNDLDNGRLICLVGAAPMKPAEFVIFRIGQKTANATS